MTDETPAEAAVRINEFLLNECVKNRDPEDYLGFVSFIFDPRSTEDQITYCSNVTRSVAEQFMHEFMARNKPARGRGK